jgi:hypothetical protein
MSAEWILFEYRLHGDAQTSEAAPQISESRRNPDPCSGRWRNHPARHSSTARITDTSMHPLRVTCVFRASIITPQSCFFLRHSTIGGLGYLRCK